MSSHWIPTIAALAICALACGTSSERHVTLRSASEGPPAVSTGPSRDIASAREMPGSLAEIPAAPAPGPALLGTSPDPTPPSDAPGLLLDAPRRSGEAPRPRILLDAGASDLGPVILGTGLEREPLAPSTEPEEAASAEERTPDAVLDTPVPASFAE